MLVWRVCKGTPLQLSMELFHGCRVYRCVKFDMLSCLLQPTTEFFDAARQEENDEMR